MIARTFLIAGELPGAIRRSFKLIVSSALTFVVLGWPPALAGDPIDPVATCSRAMTQQPQFADIVGKLPLTDITQISFAILANEAHPTEKERREIAAWFDGHEACRKSGDEYRRTQYPPDIYALLQEGENKLQNIGIELYRKKIPYGEANKRLQQITGDILGRLAQIIKEYQREIAAQKAVKEQREQEQQAYADLRQAQAEQRALQFTNFMRANPPLTLQPVPFHPLQTQPTFNCTAQQSGNFTYTNCH